MDQSGAVLPNVEVTIKHVGTGATRTVATDEHGIFRALLLPVGRYDVSVEFSGFGPFRQPNLLLTVGQTATLDIRLTVAGARQEVSVIDEAPIVETSRTQVSSTVD